MLRKAGCIVIALMLVLSLGIASLVTASAESGDGLYVYTADKVYNPQVGDIITYKIDLQAEELFENAHVQITYDSTKLKVMREVEYGPDTDPWEMNYWEVESPLRCPNLTNTIVNLSTPGSIKFVATTTSGYNFKEEKNLFNVQFEVVEEGVSEINLIMKEMWIKGGEEAYFQIDKNAPVVTEGISINEYVADMQECTDYPERPSQSDTTPPSIKNETILLYFYAGEDWAKGIYCYSFEADNILMPNGTWPGVKCGYNGNGVYYASVPVCADYVIFNDDASNMTNNILLPQESMVAVFTGSFVTNSNGMKLHEYKWAGVEILDEIIKPEPTETTVVTDPTVPTTRPTYPVVRPTYPDSPATPDEVWPEEPWYTLPTEPCETNPVVTDPCETEPCDTMPPDAYPMGPDSADKPQTNQPEADPTEAPATSATSAVEDADKKPVDTPPTGAATYVYVVFAVLAMAACAVVVLRKKVNG